jgi:DNA processing protein
MELNLDNKKILVALNQHRSLGPRRIGHILAKWPILSVFLHKARKGSLGDQAKALVESLNWSQAQKDWDWQQGNDAYILSIEEDEYPSILKQIDAPPPILYVKGNLDTFKTSKLAVVGSRQPSDYGRHIADEWCGYFSKNGLVLVSGLALGIDSIAHRACLEINQKTIAVLGSGLDYIYPRQNRALAAQICQNGLLVSEFSPKTSPNPRHFPRRNRIISGLALSTLIVESAIKSGTMHTAQHAVDQNREVYVVPGRVNDPMSMGCNYLIQQGAILASCAQEVLDGVKSAIYFN